MNKTELVNKIAEQSEISKSDAAKALDAFLDAVTSELQNDGKVTLIGFGTFEVRERKARNGRNPRTGKPLKIAASKVPAFKAGKKLKDAVN